MMTFLIHLKCDPALGTTTGDKKQQRLLVPEEMGLACEVISQASLLKCNLVKFGRKM